MGSAAVPRWRTTTASSVTVFGHEVVNSAAEVFYLPGEVVGVSRLLYAYDCGGVDGLEYAVGAVSHGVEVDLGPARQVGSDVRWQAA
jgi:hypothetical protein